MSRSAFRVLLTEDSAADAELEVRELVRAGLRVAHRTVAAEQPFVEALREFSPDVILSDFSMPGFDGMAALALARELSPDTPFIFVSGTIGEEYAIRALKNGATDYVLKSNLVRLPAAVERAIADARERRERRRAEAELNVARERLTSIFTSLPDVLWSVDTASGRIVYMSPAASHVYGHAAEEFQGRPELRLEVVHPEDRARMLAAWSGLKKGEPFDIEYRVVHPDGTMRWVNNRARLIPGPGGGPERIDGLARDVTAQVEQRRRIERLSRIRELLGALSSALVRVRDRKQVFDEFCRIAVSRGGFVLARIVELDGEGRARIAATTEADPAFFQAMVEEYNRDPAGADSLLAEALRGGKPVVSNDLAADERVKHRAALTAGGNYALALLPAIVEDRVAGAIVLRAREPGFFDQEELRLLSEMASNISFALELIAKQDRISYLALYDTLTGLPNRTLFHERLSQAIGAPRDTDRKVALVLLDIERFKAINDTLGTAAGDRLLRTVALRVAELAGDSARAARVAGDQFAMLVPGVRHARDVGRIVESMAPRLLDTVLEIEGRELRVAVKAGAALFPDDGGDAEALIRNAEAALRKAKGTGDRFLFYTPHLNARVAERLDLEAKLRRAVERGEFLLHLQPKVDLATHRITGVEALLRWRSDGPGSVAPAQFVPVLEETGLIGQVGAWVMREAVKTRRGWVERGLAAPRIAVNVSAIQLRGQSFVDDVRAALGGAGEAAGLDLEITESLLMEDFGESLKKLRAVRELGVHIALDDFGTGYSSLAYLSRLPIDTVKIDRSFVLRMAEKAEDMSIVSTILSLAHALKLKVVAEGVESEEQARLLRLLRCDEMQGYLFSPAVSVDKLEALLRG